MNPKSELLSHAIERALQLTDLLDQSGDSMEGVAMPWQDMPVSATSVHGRGYRFRAVLKDKKLKHVASVREVETGQWAVTVARRRGGKDLQAGMFEHSMQAMEVADQMLGLEQYTIVNRHVITTFQENL